MGEAAICKCKHPKLYHISTSITIVSTGKIMPIEFCLECDCTKFVEEERNKRLKE